MNVTEAVQEKPVDYVSPPDYDGLWKKVIGDLFEDFMLFFAPDLHAEIDFDKGHEFLEQELYQEIIQRKGKNVADQIIKVHLKNGEDKWILIHIEVQDKDSEDFSKRMFRYFYRIYDKFDQEVYAISLMTSDQKSQYPDVFQYHFHGTTVDYTYNVYKFHEQNITELEQSDNPFSLAIIAGKYAKKYKKNHKQRYHFKVKLIEQIFERFPFYQEETHIYFNALFYFIDYILQTPTTLRLEFREEVKKIMKQEDDHMHIEKEQLPPTFKAVLKMIHEEELEKVRKRGMEEGRAEGKAKGIEEGRAEGKAKGMEEGKAEGKEEGRAEGKAKGMEEGRIIIATELIKDGFQDEKTAQLTGLELDKVIELRKLL